MLREYLGEDVVNVVDTPYKDYTKIDWILYFLEFGQFDGAHHKQWAIDQAIRVIHNTDIEIKLAKWDDGNSEYRINTVEEPSDEYKKYVRNYEVGEEGPFTYEYNKGIAP